MRYMQAPAANRRGEREVHYVPDRAVPRLMARGWTEMKRGVGASPTQAPTFDLSGAWLSARKRVRDAVGAERFPSGKAEAREWLHQAGYEVAEG